MPLDFDAVQPVETDRGSQLPALRRVRREVYRDFDPVWQAPAGAKGEEPAQQETAGPPGNVRLIYRLSAAPGEGSII